MALLSAAAALTAYASAGPDPDVLWAAYAAAQEAARQARDNWKMVRGSADEAVYWFRIYYEADRAETAAYQAWLAARNAAAR